jgi:RimJ/RimL family protein N-acetyltransferase
MILETTDDDYAALLAGREPRGLKLPDTEIAPVEILQMLADLARQIRSGFAPASWLIVEDDEIVGLCSVTRPPADGVIDIGYGIAPSRQGRGIAGRAVGDIIAWARTAPQVEAVTAETSPTNAPSQRVLARNGFHVVGERLDQEDGPLICWRCVVR